jgi:MarR family transcriptional regulator, transcriptional regulator for hemolysin
MAPRIVFIVSPEGTDGLLTRSWDATSTAGRSGYSASVAPSWRHAYHEHAYYFIGNRAVGLKFDSDRKLGFLINDLARLLRRNFDRRLQSLGLTQAQWRAIAHLSRNEGMTQVALAEILEVQAITLTRLIDRMQSAGWVERRSHPSDRRAVQLYLTGKCQPILAEMQSRASETLAEALAGIATGAEQQVVDALQRMKTNLVTAETAALAVEPKTRMHRDVGRKPARIGRAR